MHGTKSYVETELNDILCAAVVRSKKSTDVKRGEHFGSSILRKFYVPDYSTSQF